MAVPSDFDVASVIWSNLVVASTAFVVLYVAAFVFLGSSSAGLWAIRVRMLLGEERKDIAKKLDEKLAEKVDDPDKRKRILRKVMEAIPDILGASIAWGYASLLGVVVIGQYVLGILTEVVGFALNDSFFLGVSLGALIGSLVVSTAFISWIFLSLFRALKM